MSTSHSPVRVDATLEAGLSRWPWLVKWLLVIPHYLVRAVFLGGGWYVGLGTDPTWGPPLPLDLGGSEPGATGLIVKVLRDLKTRMDAASRDVFIGVARVADAAGLLTGVAHSTVLEPTGSDGNPAYRQHAEGLPATSPSQADIWLTSAESRGRQAVTRPAREGDWTAVVMSFDVSPGVTAGVAIAATTPAATDLVW